MRYIAVIGTFSEFEALQYDMRDEIIITSNSQTRFETLDGRIFVRCGDDHSLMGIEWDDFITTGGSGVPTGMVKWLRGVITRKKQLAHGT